jgi:hypothetical protein
MMTRMSALALSLFVVAATGCAAPTVYVPKKPTAHANDPYVFLGFDFTRAQFADAHFRHADLVQGKVPRWNEWSSNQALEALSPLPVAEDLARTSERNLGLVHTALVSIAEPWGAPPLPELMQEVTPYIDGGDGNGIVVFVECLSKTAGVSAHTVVFDRKDGTILLATQASASGDGFGIYDYYRRPLATIARRSARTIKQQLWQ